MLRKLASLTVASLLLASAAPAWADGTGAAAPSSGGGPVTVSGLDLAIIFIYLIGIVLLGCWAGMRRKGAKGSDYFLAGKSLSWPMIGLALFATNISTIHLVSFAQNGFTSGLTYGNFEWMAAFTLVILALFFAPFYLRSQVATLPDFMEKRYSRGSRDFLAILSIFSAIAVHIGFSLHTGAIVLEGTILQSMGWDIALGSPNFFWYHLITIIVLCGVTAIYTIVGGLLAVVLTESIQTIVLLVGAICITVIGYNMVGGWAELKANVHPVNLTILRPATDPTGITWYAVFLGYPVLGVWYWCTDQTIVQRVLGAKDENHARIGPLFAGFIKILPVFLFVLPGVMALALVNTGKIPPLPVNGDGSPMTERTYTHMIKTMLWPGMQGIVIAAMLAALMSTVSGALNSIATLFSYDIYKRWRPQTEDKKLVWIGRVATFVAMCVAIAWSCAISGLGTTIFQAMVDVFPVVAPPTAVVFLWGVFWKRTSAKAALWTLIGGSAVGMVIYVLKLLGNYGVLAGYVYPWLGTVGLSQVQPNLDAILAINSLFMSFLLFALESVFIFLFSFAFPHRHTAESEALVWRSPWDALRRSETTWRGVFDFRMLSALLVVTMAVLYFVFSTDTTYYPVSGEVNLDGKPVIGAMVYLDNDDDQLDAELSTGIAGTYAFGTTERAGGAPAGAQYRVRIEPRYDYLVRMKPGPMEEVEQVLAFMPTGTPVEEESADGPRRFVIQTKTPQVVPVADGAVVRVLQATAVPAKYRDFDSSGLGFSVPAETAEIDLRLDRDDQVAASP